MDSSSEFSRHNRWVYPGFLGLFLLIGLFAAINPPRTFVFADSDAALKETARRLAERVAAIPGLHGPLRFEWHPQGNWAEGEGTRWQDSLRDAFDRRALQLSDEAGAPALAVYAAETPSEVVLTAKTHVGDRDEVRIVALPRSLLPPAELRVAPVRLKRQLLYESSDRILDAAWFSDGEETYLAILLYKNFDVVAVRLDPMGQIQQTLPLNVAGLKPTRDPHGELVFHGSQSSARLWGKTCDFSWNSAVEAKCRTEKFNMPGDSAWPADAVLTSPCGDANWTISDPGGEPTARAVLRLAPDGATQSSSATLTSEFPGPVLNFSPEQNSGGALLMVRNLSTGNYEVYKISLACGD